VNESSVPGLGQKIARFLRSKGYPVFVKPPEKRPEPAKQTHIIAQKANTEDAEMVKGDLDDHGDIVTASVGDIDSEITVIAGDDLQPVASASK
jgi:hypothetical protein